MHPQHKLYLQVTYLVADYQSSKDWAFSKGSPTGSNQLGTNWLGWRTMQILKNHPECATVRCTTYLNADSKDGRLVVDFTLRRGAHHVSIVANQYTSSRFNLSLATASGTNASTGTGYIYDGVTIFSQELMKQFWTWQNLQIAWQVEGEEIPSPIAIVLIHGFGAVSYTHLTLPTKA